MANLSRDAAHPEKGRTTSIKMGGRAKSPFVKSWKTPSPAVPKNQIKGKR